MIEIRKLALSCLSLMAVSAAQAQLAATERVNDYGISFTDYNQFSDAAFQGTIVQYFNGPGIPAGAYSAYDWGLPGSSTIDYWGAGSYGGFDVTGQNWDPGSGTLSGNVTDVTGGSGSVDLDYGFAVNTSGNLETQVIDGYNALQISFGSPGGVEDGGVEIENLSFSGDWSDQGVGTGMSQLVSYNSAGGWYIDTDFQYDSVTNTTELWLENDNYVGDGNHNVDVTVDLFGSAAASTPGPAALAPFALGLASTLRRRRKR
jgi:MYXO-CTERM domain-containing protein